MDHLEQKVKGAVPQDWNYPFVRQWTWRMEGSYMPGEGVGPEKLFVYECRGDCSPGDEPSGTDFLGLLPEPPYYYFFFDRDASIRMARWLRDHPGWSLTGAYQLDYCLWQQIPRADEQIGPFAVRMESRPKDAPVGSGPILIRLNPGLVFGSGVHPTTRGCLLALADLLGRETIESVVDLGTGTGILAIAAALLGASRVLAVDRIPLAARAARENVRANGLEDVVDVLVADGPGVVRKSFDLLVMNLEAPFLEKILRESAGLCCSRMIISGFLRVQWDELRAILTPSFHAAGLEVVDDWCTVVLER